jgi:hypothetical protein
MFELVTSEPIPSTDIPFCMQVMAGYVKWRNLQALLLCDDALERRVFTARI